MLVLLKAVVLCIFNYNVVQFLKLITILFIELHAPISLTQKLKLMGKGGQFTHTPTFPLTCRLPQAAYMNIGVGCNYFN
jgi:hypothetical protein